MKKTITILLLAFLFHGGPGAGITVSFSQEPKEQYVPSPEPADTGPYQVGAILCPLWKGGKSWKPITPFEDRQPLLGWYDEGDPEVTDWEIKWALDHGLSFFMVCWYRQRDNFNQPVQPALGHWLHEGLPNSRYGDQIQFAIIWENQNKKFDGTADEEDLLSHLLPYWIENYFRRPNYLTFNGKPVLAVYDVKKFVSDLGGEKRAADMIEKIRAACRKAGFEGISILGHYCWGTAAELGEQARQVQRIGMDCSWSYHWPTFAHVFGPDQRSPGGGEITSAQKKLWQQQLQPNILTLSMGWDSEPWGFSYSKMQWRLTPLEFKQLCREAKSVIEMRSSGGPESRLILIDNWNEFGEGHYIMPAKGYGFGYLDAIREVFAPGAPAHTDIVPEDIGLGPYDSEYRATIGLTP